MELPLRALESSVTASRWLPWHAALVFGFLYLPIVTLIVYSFNGSGVDYLARVRHPRSAGAGSR